MADKESRRVRFTDVKFVADDEKRSPQKDKNDNAVKKNITTDRNNSRSFPVKETEMPVVEKSDEFRKKKTKKRKIKKNSVLPLGVTAKAEEKNTQPSKELNVAEPDKRNEKADKKKNKKEKTKKNKKKDKKEQIPETVATEVKRELDQKIKAAEATTAKDVGTSDKTKGRKLPCCFGFISTWLAKRKQKRRDKKRKAIESRATTPSLVQYGHKKTKGGEAFEVEIDCRHIMKKPLLPPIKQTAGPIRHGSYYQLQAAETRRAEELAKRKAAAVSYERKKIECKARKSEIDYQFRKKADLAIKCKQAGAERNRILSRRTTPRGSASNEGDPFAFVDDDSDSDTLIYKSDEDDIDTLSDPDALKVNDVDVFSY